MRGSLNKGEPRNDVARAVCLRRLGEIRDRTFEGQRHRASGLNSVTAAIILWNTVYMLRAVTALPETGYTGDDALLPYVVVHWNHINLTGDHFLAPEQTGREKAASDRSECPRPNVLYFPFRQTSPRYARAPQE